MYLYFHLCIQSFLYFCTLFRIEIFHFSESFFLFVCNSIFVFGFSYHPLEHAISVQCIALLGFPFSTFLYSYLHFYLYLNLYFSIFLVRDQCIALLDFHFTFPTFCIFSNLYFYLYSYLYFYCYTSLERAISAQFCFVGFPFTTFLYLLFLFVYIFLFLFISSTVVCNQCIALLDFHFPLFCIFYFFLYLYTYFYLYLYTYFYVYLCTYFYLYLYAFFNLYLYHPLQRAISALHCFVGFPFSTFLFLPSELFINHSGIRNDRKGCIPARTKIICTTQDKSFASWTRDEKIKFS